VTFSDKGITHSPAKLAGYKHSHVGISDGYGGKEGVGNGTTPTSPLALALTVSAVASREKGTRLRIDLDYISTWLIDKLRAWGIKIPLK